MRTGKQGWSVIFWSATVLQRTRSWLRWSLLLQCCRAPKLSQKGSASSVQGSLLLYRILMSVLPVLCWAIKRESYMEKDISRIHSAVSGSESQAPVFIRSIRYRQRFFTELLWKRQDWTKARLCWTPIAEWEPSVFPQLPEQKRL